MTLLEYIHLTRDLARSIAHFKDILEIAEAAEIEVLAARLQSRCNALSRADCRDAGSSNRKEAAQLIAEARGLVFLIKVIGHRD